MADHGPEVFRQAFGGHDTGSIQAFESGAARQFRLAVHFNGAGPAAPLARTTVLGRSDLELIPQPGKKHGFCVSIALMFCAVDGKGNHRLAIEVLVWRDEG